MSNTKTSSGGWSGARAQRVVWKTASRGWPGAQAQREERKRLVESRDFPKLNE